MMRFVLSAGVLAAMMGVAEAAPKCSPGKIYRVSKKICVDKAAAVRDGVISARQTKLKSTAARKSARAAERKARKAARAETAMSQASEASAPQRTIILPPVRNVIGSTTSPYGALFDPWSSDMVTVAAQTRFSLRMTTQD